MTAVRGWGRRYAEIIKRFGYSRARDQESAALLESILKGGGGGAVERQARVQARLDRIVRGRPAFVVGAGHSITRSLPVLRAHAGSAAVIAADSATRCLIDGGVVPDIVVTDLDGDPDALRQAARTGIMVVHAHGDNTGRLAMASGFPRCVGTTQSRPSGMIANFGGFTDGDRAAFLAHRFGARAIILAGMDFDGRIGGCSGTPARRRRVKLQKLGEAKRLLAWLASLPTCPPVVSMSSSSSSPSIPRVRRITRAEIGDIIIT